MESPDRIEQALLWLSAGMQIFLAGFFGLIGCVAVIYFVANVLGKYTARGEPLLSGQVSDSVLTIESGRRGEITSPDVYVVDTKFAVTGQGTRKHQERFTVKSDAEAWA